MIDDLVERTLAARACHATRLLPNDAESPRIASMISALEEGRLDEARLRPCA